MLELSDLVYIDPEAVETVMRLESTRMTDPDGWLIGMRSGRTIRINDLDMSRDGLRWIEGFDRKRKGKKG